MIKCEVCRKEFTQYAWLHHQIQIKDKIYNFCSNRCVKIFKKDIELLENLKNDRFTTRK